jgi:hypothetical protein
VRLTVDLVGPWLATARTEAPGRWREAVRQALREHGTLTAAAEALGVTRQGLAKWLAEDPTLASGVELRGPGRPRQE